MASIKDIANRIKEAFVNSALLRSLYSLDASKTFDEQFSAASVEALMIDAHATVGATLETMLQWHLREITKMVDEERYGYTGWYAKMMRAFQYGFSLNELNEKTYYDDTISTTAINARIIKFAFAFDNQNGLGVTIKIAKADEDGKPTPLDSGEIMAATSYINRIKPAGIPVKIINEQADKLSIELSVVFDPLILVSGAMVDDAIEKAINSYLNGIEYNGSFVSMSMIDKLQVTAGISIAIVNKIMVTHGENVPIDITSATAYVPASGAMVLASNGLTINKEAL